MKIGDEVYIHGYVDEIRQNVVIIRNDGGYFGTVAEEITNTCGDAISRAEAIEAIEALQLPIMREASSCYQFKFSGMSEAKEAVVNLPSFTPQQRTGRWVKGASYGDQYNYYQSYVCSCCKHEYDVHGWNYCPNCGAKMEVE